MQGYDFTNDLLLVSYNTAKAIFKESDATVQLPANVFHNQGGRKCLQLKTMTKKVDEVSRLRKPA